MSQTNAPASPPSTPHPREPALVWLGCTLAMITLALVAQILPFVASSLLGLVALLFLLLPRWALDRTGDDPADYGLTSRGALRGVATGLLISCLVLPAFLPFQHLYLTRVHDARLAPDLDALRRPPEPFQRYDALPPREPGPLLYADRERLHLRWHPDHEGTLTLHADGPLVDARARPVPLDTPFLAGPDNPLRMTLLSRGATALQVLAQDETAPLAATSWRIGATPSPPPPALLQDEHRLRVPLSFGWIPWMILVQTFLIALPEEFFFRGYLQARLDRIRPPRRLPGPIPLTSTIVIVSALFALTHLIFTPHPARLAVFFPSLLFGMLRDRTGGLAAPITFHAACNLFVEFTLPHYLDP